MIDFFQTRKIDPKTNLKFTLESKTIIEANGTPWLFLQTRAQACASYEWSALSFFLHLLEQNNLFEQNKGFLDVFSKVNGVKISINFSQNHSDQEVCMSVLMKIVNKLCGILQILRNCPGLCGIVRV